MNSQVPYDITFQTVLEAGSAAALRQVRVTEQNRLNDIRPSFSMKDWVHIVNTLHDKIAIRAVELCEQGMVEEGFGLPPVPYAFIAFGSAGRCESTLWSDQDNGMIISDKPSPDKEEYFALFGSKISNLLEEMGYAKCEGKVMCSEPLWSKTITDWKVQLSEWAGDFSWEPIRYLIIASDMRHISGDDSLSQEWKQQFRELFKQQPRLPEAILRNTVKHKATLNVLGQIVTERFGEHAGDFDIKYGCYIPLVNAVRYMALQDGVEETSTLGRLQRLRLLDPANPLLDSCERAFVIALQLRASTPHESREGLLFSSGYIPVRQLKQRTLWYELRESLVIVKRLHRVLQRQLRFMERRAT